MTATQRRMELVLMLPPTCTARESCGATCVESPTDVVLCFTLGDDGYEKNEEGNAVDALMKETLDGIQGKLEEPTGVAKRQRAGDVRDSDAVRRATERGTVDTNMDGTTAAAARPCAFASSVTSSCRRHWRRSRYRGCNRNRLLA